MATRQLVLIFISKSRVFSKQKDPHLVFNFAQNSQCPCLLVVVPRPLIHLCLSFKKKKFLIQYRYRRMEKQQSCKESISLVNRSPLNTSKSKEMYSFPKGGRFQETNDERSYNFYEKQSTLDKRAPSFGYGFKVDISLKNNSPSPDKYTLPSDFNKSPKKGLTIGHGRQDCKSISIFNQTFNPGPGNYNLQRNGQNIKTKTIGVKLKFPSLWTTSLAPGPGTYEVQKIDSNGLCLTSKYKTKNSVKIYPRSPEKQNKVTEMLGPGTYNTNLSSTGKQVLARNKTEKAFVFSKKARQTMNESTISPGPGKYQHYSIFGLQ